MQREYNINNGYCIDNVNTRKELYLHERVDRWMGGWVDGETVGWVSGGLVDRWMGGWADGWIGGWMD